MNKEVTCLGLSCPWYAGWDGINPPGCLLGECELTGGDNENRDKE